MLENFQLAGIVKRDAHNQLLRVPLHQDLQKILASSWDGQLKAFVRDVQEVSFNAGYQPELHERFCLQDHDLPEYLCRESSQTIQSLEPINDNESLLGSVKAIVAFAHFGTNVEVVLFQNFSRSHVIHPGRFLFLQKNTYESVERPGLTLDGKLSAVYFPADRKLLFHNFRTVNTFLPLADVYEEASEEQIRDVLSHDLLAPENMDALALDANQWFRKRFAMLKDSGVLDQFSAKQIKQRSKGYDVDIHVSKGKIIFPENKSAAKKLLQFLNEEIFRGPITETLYETNSKREAD